MHEKRNSISTHTRVLIFISLTDFLIYKLKQEIMIQQNMCPMIIFFNREAAGECRRISLILLFYFINFLLFY